MRDTTASLESRSKVESNNESYAQQWLIAHVAVCHSLLSGLLQCLILAVPYCDDQVKCKGSVSGTDKENSRNENENDNEDDESKREVGKMDDEGVTKVSPPHISDHVYTDRRYILLRAVAEIQALLDMLCEAATNLTVVTSQPTPSAVRTTKTSTASGSTSTETKKQPATTWNVIRSHASMQQAVILRLNGMAGLGLGLGLGLLSTTRASRRSLMVPMGASRGVSTAATASSSPGMVSKPTLITASGEMILTESIYNHFMLDRKPKANKLKFHP